MGSKIGSIPPDVTQASSADHEVERVEDAYLELIRACGKVNHFPPFSKQGYIFNEFDEPDLCFAVSGSGDHSGSDDPDEGDRGSDSDNNSDAGTDSDSVDDPELPDKNMLTKGGGFSADRCRALIKSHHKLLEQHVEFFLATQHPAASLALRQLADKYKMPSRMWKHGINLLVQLLQSRLPESLEHLFSFMHEVYATLVLLFEQFLSHAAFLARRLKELCEFRLALDDEEK